MSLETAARYDPKTLDGFLEYRHRCDGVECQETATAWRPSQHAADCQAADDGFERVDNALYCLKCYDALTAPAE